MSEPQPTRNVQPDDGKALISLDKISIQTICSALRHYAQNLDRGDQAGRARFARAQYVLDVLEQDALPVCLDSTKPTVTTEEKKTIHIFDEDGDCEACGVNRDRCEPAQIRTVSGVGVETKTDQDLG